MKKTPLILFFIALLSIMLVPTAQAQLPAPAIETLLIDIWPDYDKPDVLILMTGSLPPETPLPASITIPLPTDAEINAIARIANDNQMFDDIDYSTENNKLTLTTPDPRFRVEYYAPYQSNGTNHAFTFNWLADISIENILATVQQPTGATNMHVTPESAKAITDATDGFTYYTFPPTEIPAGEPFTINLSYDMVAPQLSADNPPITNNTSDTNSSNATNNSESDSSASFSEDNISWPLLIGLVGLILLIVVIIWQAATQRTQPTRKNRKPRPKRSSTAAKPTGKARFCHKCGHKLAANDKFCRECGTAVKGS